MARGRGKGEDGEEHHICLEVCTKDCRNERYFEL